MTVKTYDINELVKNHGTTFYMDDANRWGSPSISISRDYRDNGNWTFYISHSSSDSCHKGVDSLLHTNLMILQLTDAVDTMRDMLNRVDEFETAYKARKAAERAEWEAAQAARQAKIDADTQLTPSQVGHLIATICVDIKHGGQYRIVKNLRQRGSENTHRLIARKTEGGAVQFKINGTLYSKAKLADVLVKYAAVVTETVEA